MKRVAFYFILIFIRCISGDTDDIKVTSDEFLAVKNSLDFSGKVVLVTGSNSGIGAATVRLFSYLGAKVVVTGRNEELVEEVVSDCLELSPDSIEPLGIALDLTIPGNIEKLVNETIKRFKKIDVVISNAGVGKFATIQNPHFNYVYKQVKAINVDVPTELSRLAAPYLSNTNGSIVFISSILSWSPRQSTAAYSMSKSALKALAISLSQDLGPNVRVNVVSPGLIDGTRIFRDVPQYRQLVIENTLTTSTMKRVGVPLDIAKAVVFLASPLADFITGQELRLHGSA